MTLTDWAYALLGVLVGIIFVLDGWRSSPDSEASLRQSPKLRGLLFVLGAGVIPVVQTLTTEDREALALYSFWFVTSTLVLLLVVAIYALIVSFHQLREIHPEQKRFRLVVKALPLAALALQEGLPSFHTEIDQLLVQTLIGQRNWAIDFQLAYLEALVPRLAERHPARPVQVPTFIAFVDHFLATVLTNVLEGSPVLENFRASVYFLPLGEDELRYLTGFAPKTAPHSRGPLPLDGSLAGWALRNRPNVHEIRMGDHRRRLPFHQPDRSVWYRSIAAVAVGPLPRTETAGAGLVLCIDSKREAILDPLDYNRRIIFTLGILLGNAALSMGIDGSALEAWLGDRREP